MTQLPIPAQAAIAAALALIAAPALAQTASPPPMSAPPAAPQPAGTVTVKGPGGDTATVTEADLQSMHRYNVTVGWGGGHTYAGAALGDLLAEVGAPSEARMHGPALDQVVIVKGRDGFIGVLAIAETSMTLKGQPVILADQEDGKPLNGKEGPYRLIIGGELKPPRSVWGVVSVELRPIK